MGEFGANLPAVNATLNGLAGVLLVVGLVLIKRGRRDAHAKAMIAATLVSAVFLVSYLTYHFAVVPELGHTRFQHESGLVRAGYYVLLVTHVVGATVNLPMILRTLWLAHRRDWPRHRSWARWTWPLWFYVSVTGVLVYLALYQFQEPLRG
ncbi:MAG: DUF420 domain-containing protein [Planctomycetota bacterium]